MENVETPRTRLRKPIQYQEFMENINKVKISSRKIRYFLRSSDFFNLPCRNHQLHFFIDFFKENYRKTFFNNELAPIFDMNPKTVRKNLREGIQYLKPPGRHRKLDDDTEDLMIHEINDRFQTNNPMTQSQVIDFVKPIFNKR